MADFRAAVQCLGEAVTALNRVGSLLNQHTRYLHQGGDLADDHRHLLARIAATVDRLDDAALTLVRDRA